MASLSPVDREASPLGEQSYPRIEVPVAWPNRVSPLKRTGRTAPIPRRHTWTAAIA